MASKAAFASGSDSWEAAGAPSSVSERASAPVRLRGVGIIAFLSMGVGAPIVAPTRGIYRPFGSSGPEIAILPTKSLGPKGGFQADISRQIVLEQGTAELGARSDPSLQHVRRRRLRFGLQVRVAVQDPCAGVPAQDRIVVARRAQLDRALEVRHRLQEPGVGDRARTGIVPVEHDLGAPLAEQPVVVGAAVLVAESLDQRMGLVVLLAQTPLELLGERQDQGNPGRAVVRIDLEDVAANALRLERLAQQAVAVGLLDGRGQGFPGEGLELEHGGLLIKGGKRAVS